MRDRRTFLRGLAVAPFASVPAVAMCQAAEPDPTFALIEAHRAAWEHFGSVCAEFSGKLADEPPAFVAKRDAASEAESEALEALLTPAPTTLPGLRALAEHLLDYDVKMNGDTIYRDEHDRWALETIVEACRNLFPGGAA